MWFSSFGFVFFLVIFVIAMSLFPFSVSENSVFLLRVRGSVQIIVQISDYRSKKIGAPDFCARHGCPKFEPAVLRSVSICGT